MRNTLLVLSLIASGSCAARSSAPPSPTTTPAAASATRPHENLNAVVWMQTALEYEASAVQAYRQALLQLESAQKDGAWSAALE